LQSRVDAGWTRVHAAFTPIDAGQTRIEAGSTRVEYVQTRICSKKATSAGFFLENEVAYPSRSTADLPPTRLHNGVHRCR
jgi:hypothetical protein